MTKDERIKIILTDEEAKEYAEILKSFLKEVDAKTGARMSREIDLLRRGKREVSISLEALRKISQSS